jgi:NitT/TauT family transport system substrate-binding protein
MESLHIRFLRYSAFYSPLLLTMSAGHLHREGLEATYDIVAPGRTIPDGIRDGSVQVAQSATAVSFGPWERGEPLPFRHFALLNSRDGFFLARRTAAADDFDWHSLEGRGAIIDHFFQPMAMFRRALHLKGIDARSIDIIDAGDVQAIERAYREGRGDFVHMQGPAPQQLEHEGLGSVCASIGEIVGPVAFSTLCAAPEWLGSDQARAFVRAFRAAREQAQHAPAEEVSALVADFLPGVDRAALTRTISAYQSMDTWAGGIDIMPELYDLTVDVFLFSGDITRRPRFADIVTPVPV